VSRAGRVHCSKRPSVRSNPRKNQQPPSESDLRPWADGPWPRPRIQPCWARPFVGRRDVAQSQTVVGGLEKTAVLPEIERLRVARVDRHNRGALDEQSPALRSVVAPIDGLAVGRDRVGEDLRWPGGRDGEILDYDRGHMIDPVVCAQPRLSRIGALEDSETGRAGIEDREISRIRDERIEPNVVSAIGRAGPGRSSVVAPKNSGGPTGHIDAFRSRTINEERRDSRALPHETCPAPSTIHALVHGAGRHDSRDELVVIHQVERLGIDGIDRDEQKCLVPVEFRSGRKTQADPGRTAVRGPHEARRCPDKQVTTLRVDGGVKNVAEEERAPTRSSVEASKEARGDRGVENQRVGRIDGQATAVARVPRLLHAHGLTERQESLATTAQYEQEDENFFSH
jgi:hypothetical protein